MKNHIRDMMVLAFLMLASSTMWAKGQVTIVQTGQGNASFDVKEESVCELTMVPASGYYVTAEYIKVVKTIDGGSAHSPKRTPAVAEPIALTALNPDANPTETTRYTFAMEGNYDYEVTVDFQSAQANNLFLVNGRMVTEQNRGDILNDGGTMKFNASNNRIVFTKLSSQDVNIESWMDNMVVYLKEGNSMAASDGFLFKGHGGNLTFTTDGNDAGTLALGIEAQVPVIGGFNLIIFEQNLTLLSGSYDGQEAVIGTPVKPIADEDEPANTVDLGDTGDTDDFSNTIINDVLYTLDAGNDDGIDTEENSVVLGSSMAADDINEIVDNYTPGSEEFAEHFAGVTFMIPAGTGSVLVTAKTGEEGVIHVKIGSQPPFVISGVVDYTAFEIPYACTVATYVYIYNASPAAETAEAADHRAGKKTTVTVGLATVGVKASSVQSSNSEGNVENGVVEMTSEDITLDVDRSTFVVNNSEVNTLNEDLFSNLPFMKYVDLRNTSVTGVNVSREDGPFAGVSKNTFIYMPVGNTTDEPNVIIGNICEKVVLDANMAEDESFGLSGNFVAGSIELNRTFQKDETTTLCLPFAISASDMKNFGEVYHVQSVDGAWVKIEEVTDGLKAHVPYLFKAAADDTQLYTKKITELNMPEEPAGVARRAESSAVLVGCYDNFYSKATDGAFRFVANDNLEQIKFVRMQDGERIKPFEAYLKSDSQTDELGVTDKEVTAIEAIANSQDPKANGPYYDLQGRRMANGQKPTAKGIYIINGQKTVIR